MKITAQFPNKLRFLFTPARYKVARGGRSAAKSWAFSRALLILGVQKKIRVMCAREVQLSIKQSVHKLLKDQIEILGLESHYRVLDTEIRAVNGTEFAFCGLSALTVDTIKSYEGVDYCWVEEGQTISKRSWDILIPTIRNKGSEIWVSYNPDLESDETHQRFTINPPPDCINVLVNWRDNPWFTDVSEAERLHCQKTDPDNYGNIWEGECRPAVEGAIYFKQIQEMEAQGRICNVPYDPLLKVHVVADLGWSDSMAIGMVQRGPGDLRIIDYIEDTHKTNAEYSAILKDKGYDYGQLWLPHDGYSGNVQTGLSSADIFAQLGWSVPTRDEIVEMSVEEGIRVVRQMFGQIYIDKTKCAPLVEALKRYRRHINRVTDAAGKPVHDGSSHGADMIRYACINASKMNNSVSGGSYKPKRKSRARA